MKKIIFTLLIIFGTYLQVIAGNDTALSYEDHKKFDYFYLEALRQKLNGQHSEAFQSLQHALSIDSTSAAALFEISHYYSYLRDDSLALDALEKAVEYKPDIYDYKLALATQYIRSEKIGEAVSLFENLSEENPENIDLHFYLVDLYIQLKAYEKAIESLDNLENNLGMHETISLQKFNLYDALGEKEKGIQEIEKLAKKHPYESRYQFILGDIFLQQNEAEKARAYFEKGYENEPSNPYYLISMVNYYKFKNEPDSTNILFENMIEKHSQEVEINKIYGLFLLSQNRLDEAKFQFQIVTESNPEDFDSWRNLLAISLNEDNPDGIISICDKALLHFPNEPDFVLYRGFALYRQERYEEALVNFEEGIEGIHPSNRALLSTFYGQIGDIQFQLKNKEKAYQAYDKALELNENNILILNNYAYYLSLDKDDLDKAERMSSKTIQIDPNNPTYLDTYAWVFFQKGNYSLAKFYIESAISKGEETSSEVLEHYGDILFKNGLEEKAVQEWERALSNLDESDEERKALLQKKIKDKTYYEK